eukprot:gene23067-biopygen11797
MQRYNAHLWHPRPSVAQRFLAGAGSNDRGRAWGRVRFFKCCRVGRVRGRFSQQVPPGPVGRNGRGRVPDASRTRPTRQHLKETDGGGPHAATHRPQGSCRRSVALPGEVGRPTSQLCYWTGHCGEVRAGRPHCGGNVPSSGEPGEVTRGVGRLRQWEALLTPSGGVGGRAKKTHHINSRRASTPAPPRGPGAQMDTDETGIGPAVERLSQPFFCRRGGCGWRKRSRRGQYKTEMADLVFFFIVGSPGAREGRMAAAVLQLFNACRRNPLPGSAPGWREQMFLQTSERPEG